ncbi:MAG: hypothetical protein SF123_17300 [Chloroflexota bacterium]|nr:hypothetical protein [Chloroflexota bacterium]
MIIELKGSVTPDGKIVLDTATPIPPGDVHVVIAYPDATEAQDEAEWDAQFAATPAAVFDALIQSGIAEYERGETEAFDPTREDI